MHSNIIIVRKGGKKLKGRHNKKPDYQKDLSILNIIGLLLNIVNSILGMIGKLFK